MGEVTEHTIIIHNVQADRTTIQDISETTYDTSSLAELTSRIKRTRRTARNSGFFVEGTSAVLALIGGYAILNGITHNNAHEVIDGFSELIGAGFGYYTGAAAWLQKQRYDRQIATIQRISSRLSRQGHMNTP